MSRPADENVDFVVGDQDASTPEDEELASPPERDPRTRRGLAAGAAVLVGAALIARAVSGHHGGGPASTSAPSVAGSGPIASGRFHPPPDVVGSASIVVPEGNRPGAARPRGAADLDCPRFATCSLVPQLPAPALAAVRDQFPGAVVVSSPTVLANRPGHFEPDLLRRTVVARSGPRVLTVAIRKPRASDSAKGGRRTVGGKRTSYYLAVARGFTVSVTEREPVATPPVPLNRLAWLAGDDRLIAPQ